MATSTRAPCLMLPLNNQRSSRRRETHAAHTSRHLPVGRAFSALEQNDKSADDNVIQVVCYRPEDTNMQLAVLDHLPSSIERCFSKRIWSVRVFDARRGSSNALCGELDRLVRGL